MSKKHFRHNSSARQRLDISTATTRTRRGVHVPAHLGLLLVHLRAGVAEVPGEPEVGDLADPLVVEQDVPGGQVPVDDALGHDVLHALGNAVGVLGQVLGSQAGLACEKGGTQNEDISFIQS